MATSLPDDLEIISEGAHGCVVMTKAVSREVDALPDAVQASLLRVMQLYASDGPDFLTPLMFKQEGRHPVGGHHSEKLVFAFKEGNVRVLRRRVALRTTHVRLHRRRFGKEAAQGRPRSTEASCEGVRAVPANEEGVTMAFKPKTREQELTYAEEAFRVDMQYAIQKLMKLKGVTQHELATRLGVTDARVSHMLSFKGNLTVRQVGRVFAALGEEARITCDTLQRTDPRDVTRSVRLENLEIKTAEIASRASAMLAALTEMGREVTIGIAASHQVADAPPTKMGVVIDMLTRTERAPARRAMSSGAHAYKSKPLSGLAQ